MRDLDSFRIPVEKLKKTCLCDEELKFDDSVIQASEMDGVIGQERGVHAMQFGLNMDAPGYNIFVAGPQGTGKNTYAKEIVSILQPMKPGILQKMWWPQAWRKN